METAVKTTARSATKNVKSLIDDEALDAMMNKIDAEGLDLLGPDGVLKELTKRIMERALEAELTHHLGYEKGDPAGNGSGNSRNGTPAKTVLTDAGDITLDVPRDRDGSFTPKLVPKGQRRIAGFNELVCGLVSRGMTTRDVQGHIRDVYGVDISPDLVSDVTDAILPELKAWQSRPLDEVYVLMYLDAIVVKVRTDGAVANTACHIAMGVDEDGRKHVLGMYLQKEEGAKFWLSVLTDLRNRGVRDVLIVCCDGLTGFPAAIEAVWPQTTVQTCVVHLIRNSVRYCSWKDRKEITAALKPIYNAPNIDAAADALDTFEIEHGDKYPAIVGLWRRHWTEFTPFLQFDMEIRKIIYTTNAIESLNFQLRKVTKTKGHFPTNDAVLKIFYMAIMNIGTTRKGACGTGTKEWARALNAFSVAFPNRLSN
jgi:putative transposase